MSEKLVLEKNLITTADIAVGIGQVEQMRQQEATTLLQVNAAELKGAIVVEDVTELEALDITLIPTQTAIVKATHSVYTYNETDKVWGTSGDNLVVVDSLAKIPSDTTAVLAYLLDSNEIAYRVGTTWSLDTSMIKLADNTSDLTNMSNYSLVYVKSMKSFYERVGLSWQQVVLSESTEFVKTVATVTELENLDSSYGFCILTDKTRGGLFKYDATQSTYNDKGTVFNGWMRIFSGDVSLEWFGAAGDGTTDDSEAIQAAINSGYPIFVNDKTYLISQPITIDADVEIDSNGGTLQLEGTGELKFSGSVSDEMTFTSNLTLGQNEIEFPVSTLEQTPILITNATAHSSYSDKVKTSQFNMISRYTGNLAYLLTSIESNYTTPNVKLLAMPRITISSLNIINNTSTPVTFNYCMNILLNNVKIYSESVAGVKFNKCYIANLVQCQFYSTIYEACIVDASDNIIFDVCEFAGATAGVKIDSSDGVSNHVGLFKCIITSEYSVNAFSLWVGPSLSGLNVENCQLSGSLYLSCASTLFYNCVIMLPNNVTLASILGDLTFDSCSIVALSSVTTQPLLGNSAAKELSESWDKATTSAKFKLISNTLVVAANIYTIFEAKSADSVYHTISFKENKIGGITTGIESLCILKGTWATAAFETIGNLTELNSDAVVSRKYGLTGV